ncbi:MAG: nucleoside 2-deoxyribosyltransferase [Chitinophagales bacterium]|nr:nucleoside 2-deoxyribosyltransferase [Chitinophagales bacterium]
MTQSNICLIGDVVVDVTLKDANSETKLRMGGIVHAARCLWALNIPFSVGYFAPSYLDAQIHDYLNSLGCTDIIKIGNVVGSPYVFLIEEAKEIGDQGYELLLRDEIQIEYNESNCESLFQKVHNDYLLISGNYDLVKLANQLSGKIHIDVANNIKDIASLCDLKSKLETIFISTSSDIFKASYDDSFLGFTGQFENKTKRIILKENRGGSRGYDFLEKAVTVSNAQTQPIIHSVGVGDVYCAAFVSQYHEKSLKDAMVLSSWIATEYAITTYPDDFKKGVARVIQSKVTDLVNIEGVSLPWEKRNNINIYIAAPDFDFVDTKPINILVDSLRYHNFKPRRPIEENGQMAFDATKARKQEIFSADMKMFDECSILIAVLLYDDPGTLIEIGLAAAKGLPTIVYDPYNRATNCMLTELPRLVTSNLDEVIAEVFIAASKLNL